MNSQQPESSKNMSASAGKWVILIIILIIAGGGIYLSLQEQTVNSNTNSPANTNLQTNRKINISTNLNVPVNANVGTNENVNTSPNTNSVGATGWRQYRNEDKRMEVMYPETWEYMTRPDESVVFAPNGNFGDFPEVSIRVTSSTSTNTVALKAGLRDMSLSDRNEPAVAIDGQSAFLIQGYATTVLSNGQPWYIQRALLEVNETVVEIDGNNANEVFMQFLESFHVL